MAIQSIYVEEKGAKVGVASIYRFEGINETHAKKLQKLVLTDPVTQISDVNAHHFISDKKYQEIGYKPGVTDPIELSLKKAANLVGIFPRAVSSSHIFKSGHRTPTQIEEVIRKPPKTLIVKSKPTQTEIIPIRNLTDSQLVILSNVRSLFLNLEEMQVLQNHYKGLGRDPTDVELETFAQTWSEHCVHKTFKAKLFDGNKEKAPLFERIKKTSKKYFKKAGVVSAFSDNAGGINFYDSYVIIGKGETHNSPVAIEPYAGSLTKNGGLYRDIAGFGQGAKNIVSFMINNFASPQTPSKDIVPGSLHPKQLLLENSRGEREYGNPMGIPTHGISIHTDADFGPKPTSLGIAIGLLPKKCALKQKPKKEDLIVSIGGKTGRDGIHGATFSSGAMDAATKLSQATAVQLGDPIVEKAMFDAIIACRDRGLIKSITDCGAGGYASAIGEMASGIGATITLEKIPKKYQGLSAWELWLSESQERMVVAIRPKDWKEFKTICRRYETEATVIGRFSGDNYLTITIRGKHVASIDLSFLHHGLPQRKMSLTYKKVSSTQKDINLPKNLVKPWKQVLSHMAVTSKEPMQRMYDQTVQGMTVLSSFTGVFQDMPGEATVLAPFSDKDYGIVASHAINPLTTKIDPYWGSIWAFALAASKFTAVGGDIKNAAGIDNYITGFPDEETLGDLDRMTDGLTDMIDVTGVPMVSGKDSLSSTYRHPGGKTSSVPPSLNVTIFGKIPDITKTVSSDFKTIGSTICLVGKLDAQAMAGSIYFDCLNISSGQVPRADKKILVKVLDVVHKGIRQKKIKSAKAIAEGGLAAALSLMCFGGDCGAKITISFLGGRVDFALFNETTGCFVVEVDSLVVAKKLFQNVPYTILGKTQKDKSIRISQGSKKIAQVPLYDLKNTWQKTVKQVLSS